MTTCLIRPPLKETTRCTWFIWPLKTIPNDHFNLPSPPTISYDQLPYKTTFMWQNVRSLLAGTTVYHRNQSKYWQNIHTCTDVLIHRWMEISFYIHVTKGFSAERDKHKSSPLHPPHLPSEWHFLLFLHNIVILLNRQDSHQPKVTNLNLNMCNAVFILIMVCYNKGAPHYWERKFHKQNYFSSQQVSFNIFIKYILWITPLSQAT